MAVPGINLRLLAVGLAGAIPQVQPSEVDEIRSCPDQAMMLLVLRIITRVLVRTKVLSSVSVDKIIASATESLLTNPLSVMSSVGSSPTIRRVGEYDPYELIRQIDALLASPSRRIGVPTWFMDDFWPGCLRRLASGEKLSERDAGIARLVLTDASGG